MAAPAVLTKGAGEAGSALPLARGKMLAPTCVRSLSALTSANSSEARGRLTDSRGPWVDGEGELREAGGGQRDEEAEEADILAENMPLMPARYWRRVPGAHWQAGLGGRDRRTHHLKTAFRRISAREVLRLAGS